MSNIYYEAVDKLEKAKVDPEYIAGWSSGFLHNPGREEQTNTDAFEAGYADGRENNLDNFKNWIKG